MFDSIASAVGKGVDQAIDVGKSWLSYNQSKHQFADQMAFSREQLEFQKALLKNQMQWRVEDAKAAGLHPMAALGLSPSSFSPISAPSSSLADLGFGSSDFAGLGQNIDRAIMAGKNQKERADALKLQKTETDLRLKNQNLQNDLLEVELADKRFRLQQQLFPPAPTVNGNPWELIEGQADSVRGTKLEPVPVSPYAKTGQEPGLNPSVGWIMNPDGTLSNVQSEKAKERLEDDFIGDIGWSVENRLFPHARWVLGMDNDHNAPPRSLLPKGAKSWKYTGWGSWRPVYD